LCSELSPTLETCHRATCPGAPNTNTTPPRSTVTTRSASPALQLAAASRIQRRQAVGSKRQTSDASTWGDCRSHWLRSARTDPKFFPCSNQPCWCAARCCPSIHPSLQRPTLSASFTTRTLPSSYHSPRAPWGPISTPLPSADNLFSAAGLVTSDSELETHLSDVYESGDTGFENLSVRTTAFRVHKGPLPRAFRPTLI
jgi:hypothetical protein